MSYLEHCSCVIDDAGYYKNYVLVRTEQDAETGLSVETVMHYTMQDGEVLLDAPAPVLREAIGDGFVRPLWDEAQWAEGATAEEIAQWELDNPSPVVVTEPTEAEQLRADVDFLALMGGVTL